jgi:hypothetical protein
VNDTLGDTLVVESVDLKRSGVVLVGTARVEAYLLTAELVLQQLGALLVVGGYAQPRIGAVLLDTEVAGDAPLVVVDVLRDGSQLGHLASLRAGEVLDLLCCVAENCGRHIVDCV